MSHLIAPSHTVVDSIPLGRRIYEIAKEKGSAFTITAMANRLNMSRETLRLMIKGEREIYTFELESISALLKVPVERILQEDIRGQVRDFQKLLEEKWDIEKAIEIGVEIAGIAIGMTEKSIYLSQLARAYFFKDDKEKSHSLLLEAYHFAEQVAEKFNDDEQLYEILSKLMLTYSEKQDYTQLANILDRVEPLFRTSPKKQGVVFYSKAMIAFRFKNVQQTRENLVKSLQSYLLDSHPNNVNNIARAELNIGFFEFTQKNYAQAKKYLEQALEHVGNDLHTKLVAIKEYAKILLKLEEKEKAIDMLEGALAYTSEYPVLKGKFYMLLSIANDDVSYAESIFSMPEVGQTVLRMNCRFLTKYYMNLGDSEAVLKYSILEEKYLSEHKDIIDEEDF